MKKIIVITIFILFIIPICFADIKFTFDSQVSFIRGSQISPSFGFSAGVNTKKTHYNVYFMTMLVTSPGGSRSGMNMAGEFSLEGGGRAIFDMIDYDPFTLFSGVSLAYYAQLISLPNEKNNYYKLNNGIMIRPQFGIRILKNAFTNVELGLGYQKTLWPSYNDYDGFFILVRFMKY